MRSDEKIIKNKVGLLKLSELPIARTATVTTSAILPASPTPARVSR